MGNFLNTIAQKAQSELLLFLILIVFVAVFMSKPLTKYFSIKNQKNNERDIRLLEVIQGNSSVMAELKTLLTNTNENCRSCKKEQLAYFKRFEDKQDNTSIVLNNIGNNINTVHDLLKGRG